MPDSWTTSRYALDRRDVISTDYHSQELPLLLSSNENVPDVYHSNSESKMETDTLSADTQSVDTAEVDPLQDLSDEQLYQLVEETLWESLLCIYLVYMSQYNYLKLLVVARS